MDFLNTTSSKKSLKHTASHQFRNLIIQHVELLALMVFALRKVSRYEPLKW